jgi:hypothetical protein
MARTSNRRWKGCMMCKGHKYAQQGDGVRIPRAALLQMGVLTRDNRINRHDIPVCEPEQVTGPDCRHGCNGDCVVTGSLQCNFTCHDNELVKMAQEAWASRV